MAISPQMLVAWIDAVGWSLLHFVWQGSVLGAAYRLARPLCADVTARYRLGLGFLIALMACPLATLAYLWPAHAAQASAAMHALPAMTVGAGAAPSAMGFDVQALLPWLVGAWFFG